jgi:hypothetical protein
MFDC